jgi:Family of unknown function (DUF5996)
MIAASPSASSSADWPALAYDDWADTAATLHMWTQIVGKVRMVMTPPVNHWWHVPLYVNVRGLTTSPIPLGGRTIEIVFDFLEHRLRLTCSDGREESFALAPMSVAEFYRRVMDALAQLGAHPRIWTTPCEVENPIPFETDETHRSYDATAAQRFWRVLVQADRAMKAFRGGYLGKVSPVHFFWGSFDLAETRFSGRRAPVHPGSPLAPASVSVEAYSHEVSSCGFWPGAPGMAAMFYAYAYPEPVGFKDAPVKPSAAHWDAAFGEFVLSYEAMRTAPDPDAALTDFFQSTYQAAADLARWPRKDLERA